MPSVTWSGNFGAEAAGTNGRSTTLTSSGVVPANAVITSVEYSLSLTSGGYSRNNEWRLFWIIAYNSSNTTAAHIGTQGSTTTVDTETMSSTSHTFTGYLTLDNASVFKNNTSITVHAKANTSHSSQSLLRGVSITVNYNTYSISWNSGASMSGTQSGLTATLTKSGNATVYQNGSAYSTTITYQLMLEGSIVGTFNSSGQCSYTVATTGHDYQFYCIAKATVSGVALEASGPSCIVSIVGPTFSWSSGANLSFSESAGNAVIGRNGYASVSSAYSGYTIYYRLFSIYSGSSVRINGDNDTGSSWTSAARARDVSIAYRLDAYIMVGSTVYDSGESFLSVTGTVHSPSLSWPSGAHITFSNNSDLMATITRTANAVINYGYSGTVYYRLFCEDTRKNNNGDTAASWNASPNSYNTNLTWKVDAYVTISGTSYYSSVLTVQGTVSTQITWSSGAYVGISQTGKNITVTRNGEATESSHATITYTLKQNGTTIAVMSGASYSWTLSSSDYGVQYTFAIEASASGTSSSITVNYTVLSPGVAWPAGASLTFGQSGTNVVITRTSAANVQNGFNATVYYRIWSGSNRKNSDGDTSDRWEFAPDAQGTAITYCVRAYITLDGTEYNTSDIIVSGTTVVSNTVAYYDYDPVLQTGRWIECIAYVYDYDPVLQNGTWIECVPYVYQDGWKECSYS